MERFEQLEVWKKAHQLVLLIYRSTADFPDTEKYGLVSQMRRSAVSIVANMVEGAKRRTVADRIHFNVIADGSLEELKYYIILSRDLGFIEAADAELLGSLAREIGAMLNGLTKSVRDRSRTL